LRSPAAQILETALALQRAPGERFRLRERPLPAGMTHLMEVAAASPQALQAAVAELGEAEPVLLDAARFYLEQVLFGDPEADAYRVLGLAPDATPEAVRTHHRWLQRWLHPDRAQAGDATIFATRVNQAFAQLRSPEARHAYDVRLAEARLAGASAPLPPETVRRWEHVDVEAPRYGRRSRWLLAAAVVCCIVLAVLIARNPEREAPWQPGEGFDNAGVDANEHDGPAIEDRDLGILGDALTRQPEAVPTDAQLAVEEGTLPGSVTADRHPADAPLASAPPELPPGAPAPGPVATVRHDPQAPKPATFAAPARTAPGRSPDFRNVASNADAVPAAPGAAPARAIVDEGAGAVAAASPPTSRPAEQAATEAAAIAPATPALVPAPPTMASASSAEGALVMVRMRLAEQRVAEVAAFLASKPGTVPLWNDPRVLTEATRLRGQLNARKGSRLDLGRPSWRLSAERARISAGYRCRSANGGPCEGTLGIDLVWREGMWLIRDVDLGPPA
jgi:hypothetical protein